MLRRKHFYSAYPPLLLHCFSIACPSFLHRFDGLSMDYRWIILGGRGEEQGTCFEGKKSLVSYQKRYGKGMKNLHIAKRKLK